MKTLKYSRWRESIKASLMNQYNHPTTSALYASIREEFPNTSLGTVHHNLNLPVETEEIKKPTYGDGAGRFGGDTRRHYHFVHTGCNQVYNMDLGVLGELNQGVQESAPGIINSHYALFYSQYKKCSEKRVDEGTGRPV